MRQRTLLAVVLATLAACGQFRVALAETDRALGQTVGIGDSLLLLIKRAGASLRQLEGVTSGGKPMMAAGVTVDVPRSGAIATVRRLRQALAPGYLVFVSEQHFGIDGQPDQLSILRGTDPYAMLRVMGRMDGTTTSAPTRSSFVCSGGTPPSASTCTAWGSTGSRPNSGGSRPT